MSLNISEPVAYERVLIDVGNLAGQVEETVKVFLSIEVLTIDCPNCLCHPVQICGDNEHGVRGAEKVFDDFKEPECEVGSASVELVDGYYHWLAIVLAGHFCGRLV